MEQNNEKKTKQTWKKVAKWTAGIAAVLGIGYVLGNDKARNAVVGALKFNKKQDEPATPSEEPVKTPEVEAAPVEAKEVETPKPQYNNNWKGDKKYYSKNNYGYNRQKYNN